MRTHGIPAFPDPDSHGNFHLLNQQTLGVSKQTSLAAKRACQHLFPSNFSSGPPETARQRRVQLADALSFARCIRSRGVSRFPDPNPQGDLSVAMVEAQGIDVHSHAFLQVVEACLPASHGALTPAKVRQALSQ
jgi:hypothetical protein